MRLLSPVGDVYYAGTFNGHPTSVAAAMTTIDVLESDGVPQRVAELGDRLSTAVNAAIGELDVNAVCQSFGSIWTVFLGTRAVNRYDNIRPDGDWGRLYRELHLFLIQHRIFIQRRYVPRCAVSALHDEADIDWTAGILIDFLRQHAAYLNSA